MVSVTEYKSISLITHSSIKKETKKKKKKRRKLAQGYTQLNGTGIKTHTVLVLALYANYKLIIVLACVLEPYA